ncbi:MAG TPA: HAMP domain-containing sensor histidine kinase [Gemmatimonadaceae bacterium]|nr:HAMP domain-containing sensor histidine kinase [Gemmatimonadaceae bacterium]
MSDNARRYGIALLASATGLIVVATLSRILPFEPFLLFAVPVALTSRYAGRGPTALSVVLTVLAIEATLVLSRGRFAFTDAELWVHAAIFGVVAWAIDSTTEALRKARRDAERTAGNLEDLNVELEQQMDEVQRLSENLHRTNLSLARARDVAEEASRAREEILGVVAHDLRNPLNVVMMTTQLFADTQPTGEKRDQLLGAMQRASQRMNRLIEDLLEVVRQESGKMKLDVEDVSVASLVSQTAEMFQATAAEKGVSLRVEETAPDLAVRGDSERIMQVLSNLVGNALKFVPSGGRVVLKCERDDPDAICSVADSGPGIAPEDLDRLFEKFWQRRRTDKRGVGLGLAIARGIVEAHGGRIWAESNVGVGSTFYFTLPAVARHSGELQFVNTPAEAEALWT